MDAKKEHQVKIRKMTAEDIEDVLAIDRKITGSNRAMTYATIPTSYVGGELDMSVVAEASGQIVGFLFGRITESPYRLTNVASLEIIGVDPEYHRQGIGSQLVQAFTERCRQRGARLTRIMVNSYDWWLLSFISSLGFARGEMTEYVKPVED